MIDIEKRNKIMNEVKLVKNKNKNPPSLLKISPVQKQVHPLHKLQDHVNELQNPFTLIEENLSQRNC